MTSRSRVGGGSAPIAMLLVLKSLAGELRPASEKSPLTRLSLFHFLGFSVVHNGFFVLCVCVDFLQDTQRAATASFCGFELQGKMHDEDKGGYISDVKRVVDDSASSLHCWPCDYAVAS